MRLPPSSPPTDRIRFASDTVAVGAFRCPLEHPRFSDTGPIQRQIVVFPRVPVEIAHEGGRPFVADPCVATIYNLGQRYRRRGLHPAGDRCDWFAVAPAVALELARRHDPSAEESPLEPYRWDLAPVEPALYFRQRRLFERLARRDAELCVGPLGIEEEAIAIVDAVLAVAARQRSVRRGSAISRSSPHRARRAARELAERAAELLGTRLDEPLALAEIARRLGVSAPHLCRSFRRERGTTLHRHRTELRLRSALEALCDGGGGGGRDLTEVALAHGFASHSHFANAFRRRFGVAPSSARAELAGRADFAGQRR